MVVMMMIADPNGNKRSVAMEKIKALKEKHNVPRIEELYDLSRTRILGMQDNLKYKEQHLSELKSKIQELRMEIRILEETLNVEERTLQVNHEQHMKASDTLKELEMDRNQLLAEVHQLESQRNYLKNKKPNPKDEELLRNGNRKFSCYKQFTGIKWDFGAPKGTIKGYVTNGKDHIHTFIYQNKDHNSLQLENELWKQVERGTGRFESLEPDSKENTAPNH